MSIVINSNVYSNAVNTTAVANQAKNSNKQSLVQTIKNNTTHFNFDSYEAMIMDDKTYRNEIVENPNVILHNYSVYFNNALTTEIALSFYEKGMR